MCKSRGNRSDCDGLLNPPTSSGELEEPLEVDARIEAMPRLKAAAVAVIARVERREEDVRLIPEDMHGRVIHCLRNTKGRVRLHIATMRTRRPRTPRPAR